MLASYSISIWRSYKLYVKGTIKVTSNNSVRDIKYWQERLFNTGVLYGLPFTLLVLIPSIYLELESLDSMFMVYFEIITTAAFALIVLTPGLSRKLRKFLVVF